MRLRGAKVLARCDDSGALISEGGRVEIRYKPNDGRAYKAAVGNLSPDGDEALYPDDHCGPAQAPAPKRASAARASSSVETPTEPSGNEVIIYADGACSGNPGPSGIGVVMIWDGGRRELSEFLGDGTNNIAELTAISRAIGEAATLQRPLRIFTDSRYSIGMLAKGWKAKANQALIKDIRAQLQSVDNVEFIHVPGHRGVELNERADELAVQAVESRATAGWQDV